MKQIPVEPLDDARWTKIERRIISGARPMDAPRRWGEVVMAALAACTIAAAAGVIGWTLHEDARVVEAPAVASAPPLAVKTEAQRSVLDIGDATIEASPETAFVVTRPGGGVRVEMASGRVELEVGKRHGRPPLVVHAGDTEVIVVGTHFSVAMHEGLVDVQVTEGTVRVVRQQREVRVTRGEIWHQRDGVVAAVAPVIATGSIDVLHDRVAAVPESKAIVVAPPVVTHELEKPEPIARPGHVELDPHVDLRAAIRAQPVAPALELGLEPASAVAKYRQMLLGPQGSKALYSIAVLDHTKLGRDADALKLLDGYLSRFRGGDEYLAALWLRVRISCLRKLDENCRQAAYTYLDKAGETPASHIARLLTEESR